MTTTEKDELALSPKEIALLRKQVASVVKDNIEYAREVLAGTRVWNANQIRLFTALASKVVPDLHHSYAQVGIENKALQELSRDQLEEIARTGQLPQPIDAEYTIVSDNPDIPNPTKDFINKIAAKAKEAP